MKAYRVSWSFESTGEHDAMILVGDSLSDIVAYLEETSEKSLVVEDVSFMGEADVVMTYDVVELADEDEEGYDEEGP